MFYNNNNNNIANPVKWFSVLACCSSGNCGGGGSDAVWYDTYGGCGLLDPWAIGGEKSISPRVVFCARFYRQNISYYTLWEKNNGFPTTACTVYIL